MYISICLKVEFIGNLIFLSLQESMISVIVPVYKAEKYLHRCVDSILAQSYTDFELLLINDGSPDNCGAICDEYAAKDSRVRVFHKTNGGVSSARNMGLDNARGEWITFIDSDDYVHPDYLRSLYERVDVDLIVGSFQLVGSDENWIGILENVEYDRDVLRLKLETAAFPPNYHGILGKLYRARIIKDNNIRFDTKIYLSEDWLFTLNYFIYIESVCTIDKPYYYYERGTTGSLSQNNRYFEEYFYAMEKFEKMAGTLERSFNLPNCQRIYIKSVFVFLTRQIGYLYHHRELSYRIRLSKVRAMLANSHVQNVLCDSTILSKGPRRHVFDFIARRLPASLLLLYIYSLRGNAY